MSDHENDIFRVLYVDPSNPESGRRRDFHGCDPRRPTPMIALTAPAGDPTPSGIYRPTGEERNGRWIYQLDEPTT